MSGDADLPRLRAAVRPVEARADAQPWADERPWRAATHVWLEGGLVVVDLHDLKAGLAREAVERAAAVAGGVTGGAVLFVVGQGRRSRGGPVLPKQVGAALRDVARARGWRAGPAGAGRWALVVDPARAPDHLGGRLSWGARAVLLLVAVALAWVCAGRPMP